MEQIYSPAILVPAERGFCLKYIDDAGDAPSRTATARYSCQIERDAGRLHSGEIPEGFWFVGFIDFTYGAYTSYGHVFFIYRMGNSYLIYDSEVQSGTRKPYKTMDELMAWFGAYGPIFLGWSTDCDGRQYVKEEDMRKMTRDELYQNYQAVGGYDPSQSELNVWLDETGKQTIEDYDVVNQKMIKFFEKNGVGYKQYVEKTNTAGAKMEDEIEKLKASANDNFVPAGDLFVRVKK